MKHLNGRDSYADVSASLRLVLARARDADLGPTAWKVLGAILELTAGWSRLSDTASHAQIGDLAGFDMTDAHRRRALSRQLNTLRDLGLIVYRPGDATPGGKRTPSTIGLPPVPHDRGSTTSPPVPQDQGSDVEPPAPHDRGSEPRPPVPQHRRSSSDPRSPSAPTPGPGVTTTPGPPGPPFRGITRETPRTRADARKGGGSAPLRTQLTAALADRGVTVQLTDTHQLDQLDADGWTAPEILDQVWTVDRITLSDRRWRDPTSVLLARLSNVTGLSPSRRRQLQDAAIRDAQLEQAALDAPDDDALAASAAQARQAVRNRLDRKARLAMQEATP